MANNVGGIYYELDLDDKKFKSKMGVASKDVKGFGTVLENVGNIAKKAAVGLVAVGTAAVGAATFGVKSAMDMEMLRSSLDVMTGSAKNGKKVFQDLYDFAASTPFGTEELAKATQTMLGFGIKTENVMDTLKMLGDVSMGNKDKLQSLTLAYSQIQSTGKLMGQDLLQLINGGFNPLTIIAQKTGKSMSVLKDEMAEGKISAEMITEAFKTATSAGGLFYQGMDKGSKTLEGRFSTLKDVISTLARELVGFSKDGDVVAGGLVDRLKKIVEDTTTFIEKNTPKIIKMLNSIVKNGIEFVKDSFNTLKNVLKTVVDFYNSTFKPFVDDLWKVITDKLLPAFSNMVKTIQPILLPLLELIGAILVGGVILAIKGLTKVLEVIAFVFEQVAKFFDKYTPEIVDKLNYVRENGVDILKQSFEKLQDVFRGVKAVYDAFLKPAVDSLWKSISENLLPALERLWVALEPTLIPILKFLGSVVLGAVVVGLNILVYALKIVVDWLSSVIDWVTDGIEILKIFVADIVDLGKKIYNSLVEPFEKAGDWIKDKFGAKVADSIKGQTMSMGDVQVNGISRPELSYDTNSFGGGGGNVNNIYIDKVRDYQDVEAIGRQLAFSSSLSPF
jgi:tape measure domain-containing protein